jgi:hypothetical protein
MRSAVARTLIWGEIIVSRNGMIEAAEIALLLPDSTLSQPSSVQFEWDGLAIERRTVQPSEKPEVPIGHHFLILWDQHVAEGEIKDRRGQFTPYRKCPNTITTFLPGAIGRPSPQSVHQGSAARLGVEKYDDLGDAVVWLILGEAEEGIEQQKITYV